MPTESNSAKLVRASVLLVGLCRLPSNSYAQAPSEPTLGREVAVPRHMRESEEFRTPIPELIEYGRTLFNANWTGTNPTSWAQQQSGPLDPILPIYQSDYSAATVEPSTNLPTYINYLNAGQYAPKPNPCQQ
jgi:hypothetical protein